MKGSREMEGKSGCWGEVKREMEGKGVDGCGEWEKNGLVLWCIE